MYFLIGVSFTYLETLNQLLLHTKPNVPSLILQLELQLN